MKVFLSWSGEMSRELAEALRDWLPSVLQSIRPFFTPSDIEKGARWSKDIAQELDSSTVGIFCLTKENLTKPWIMFEAGALSKNLDISRVCPILFDVDNADLQGPLVQFQASPFSEGEIRKLIRTLNNTLGDHKLEDTVLSRVFNMWWPTLNEKVKEIIKKYANKPSEQGTERTDREILEEILQLNRLSTKVARRNKAEGDVDAFDFATRKLAELSEILPDSTPGLNLLADIARALDYYANQIDMPRTTRLNLEKVINRGKLLDLL
jgi:hypothetical protein